MQKKGTSHVRESHATLYSSSGDILRNYLAFFLV